LCTEQLDASGEVRRRSGAGPTGEVHAAAVDVGLAQIQRVCQERDRDVECFDRPSGITLPQENPRALGLEHAPRLIAETEVDQCGIAQLESTLQVAELRPQGRL